jgi:hypothetical protein
MTAPWIGSAEHKRLFCRVFLETHVPFDPDTIRWPELDTESLARLKALPVWNDAVRTEAATALEVQTLGSVERDPMIAEAITLQGYEEGRHAAVLRILTQRYAIPVNSFEIPPPPRDPVWTFMSTGYGECLDSFFAFGLFAIGKRSRYFPGALIDIFEPIIQEEARHILFIVNWASYLRARQGFLLRPAFDVRRGWTILKQLIGHARQATRVGGAGSEGGFTMRSHTALGDLSARSFLETCLAENDRRLAPYDSRLLRPALVPSSVRFALKFLPARPASRGGERAEPPPAMPTSA